MLINCASQSSKLKVTFQVAGALLGSFALILQLYLATLSGPKLGMTYAEGFIRFFSFMTVWTNILVTLHFIMPLVSSTSRLTVFLKKPIVQTGTLLYILFVCVTYHFLLADVWEPTGLQAVADIALHYLIPVYYLVFYLIFAPKGLQIYRNSFKWLIYPLIYIIFSMIYGGITHQYPYYFIDLSQLGLTVILRNIFLLSVAYYLSGLLLIFADKKIARTPV